MTTMNSFYKYFDWNHDIGLNVLMIQDQLRNQFYDRVFSQTVKGQRCVEIGFGTGILSLLAIKHGAEHVVAYEKNNHYFEFGKYLVNKLDLNNKITLVNQQYNHDVTIPDHLVFHELLDQNIWGENIINCVNNAYMIPEIYYCKFYVSKLTKEEFFKFKNDQALEIKWQTFYQTLKQTDWPESSRKEFKNLSIQIKDKIISAWYNASARTSRWNKKILDELIVDNFLFQPGVQLDQKFIDLIQDTVNKTLIYQRQKQIHDVDFSIFSNQDYQRLILSGQLVSKYIVNVNQKTIETENKTTKFDQTTSLDISLDKEIFKNEYSIIIPTFGVQHGSNTLEISPTTQNPNSHWSIPNGIKLCEKSNSNITIKISLNDSQIRYY